MGEEYVVYHCDPSLGTEELGHLEMVGTIVYQLTRDMTPEQIKAAGFEDYFVDHTAAVYPTAASGMPFNAAALSVTGDTIADLHENLSAEQKARMTYDNILRFTDDPDVRDPIKFLRAREVVHFQRFGEANHTKLSGCIPQKTKRVPATDQPVTAAPVVSREQPSSVAKLPGRCCPCRDGCVKLYPLPQPGRVECRGGKI